MQHLIVAIFVTARNFKVIIRCRDFNHLSYKGSNIFMVPRIFIVVVDKYSV